MRLFAIFIVAAFCSVLRGDCGAIPFVGYKYVDVFEPNQRAFIAWNGHEEMLILSTDLSASQKTKVLEVIPLPSEPKVTEADVKIFKAAVDLLNSKLPKVKVVVKGSVASGGESDNRKEAEVPPVAEITFHEKMGATDVSVVHVRTPEGFVEWVEKYLKSQQVNAPSIPAIMKKTVEEYLSDGYKWFVFNVVSLDKEVRSKQAIRYHFAADCLYYPMRISRTDKGDTHISLTILTNNPFDLLTVTGAPEGWLKVAYQVVTATDLELEKVDRDCWKLLGRPPQAKLRVWKISGELAKFNEDILAGKERTFSLKQKQTGKIFGPFPLRRGADVQIGQKTFSLLVAKKGGGDVLDTKTGAFLFNLRPKMGVVKDSNTFKFVDGSTITLADETFILQVEKPPTAIASDVKSASH